MCQSRSIIVPRVHQVEADLRTTAIKEASEVEAERTSGQIETFQETQLRRRGR